MTRTGHPTARTPRTDRPNRAARRSALVRRGGTAVALAVLGTVAPLLAPPASAAPAGVPPMTFLASSASNGASINGSSTLPLLSADGEHVAFDLLLSKAAGGTGVQQVRTKDRVSGELGLASVSSKGEPANAAAFVAGIDESGTRVAFVSAATNLGGPQTTGVDLYVRDVVAGTTKQVNLSSAGTPLPVTGGTDGSAALSANGNVVAWEHAGHLFRRDLVAGTTRQLDVNTNQDGGNGVTRSPSLSAKGDVVAFESSSSNLVAGDANGQDDIFIWEAAGLAVSLMSRGVGGSAADGGSQVPSISDDGTAIAYTSNATNLVAGDTNTNPDVFVTDRDAGTITRVSLTDGDQQSNAPSGAAAISGNGRRVLFHSVATNLVPGDGNSTIDVFVRDRLDGTTHRASVPGTGPTSSNEASFAGSIDRTGNATAYSSRATNLVAGDANGFEDVFVHSEQPIAGFLSYAAFLAEVSSNVGASTTPSGLLAQLQGGRRTAIQAVIDLDGTPGFRTHREPVTRLFAAFFRRSPDQGGLDFWAKKHAGGTKLRTIAASFAASSEFKNTYGKLGNQAFVQLVFKNVLHRDADAAGLAFWTQKLDGGSSRGDVMTQFSESSEGRRELSPIVDSTLLFLAVFGELPDRDLSTGISRVLAATDIPHLVQELLGARI